MRRLLPFAASLSLAALALPTAAESAVPQVESARAGFLANPTEPPKEQGVLCVVDSGVDDVPDLDGLIVGRESIVNDPGFDDPARPHGTYVASVAAARANDGYGIEGIWPGMKILSVKTLSDSEGVPTAADYVAAIGECVERRLNDTQEMKAITLAIGAPRAAVSDQEFADLRDSVKVARRQGLSVVAAVGNTGEEVLLPALIPEVVAVSAVDSVGGLCTLSARGPEVDVAALGCGVALARRADGVLGRADGTSFAAPAVAAALTALRSFAPELTVDSAEAAVLESARVAHGGRVLDVEAAFHRAALGRVIRDAQSPPDSSIATAPPPPELAPRCDAVRKWCAAPELAAVTRRGSRLTLTLARVPKGARVSVRANGRSLKSRRRGRIVRVVVRRLRRVEVRFFQRDRGYSPPLVLTRRDVD